MFPVLKISQVKNSFRSFVISSSDFQSNASSIKQTKQTKVLNRVNGHSCKKEIQNYFY
jgi:hypothetical protein